MSFIANYDREFKLWDYIVGNIHKGMSIVTQRYYYLLFNFSKYSKFQVACRDPTTNAWTKWSTFPGALLKKQTRNSQGFWQQNGGLTPAIDVHRSILPNEIVIESDYPTYEENYDATKILGAILENKGFFPYYYYSGNKSIHTHVYFDWKSLFKTDMDLQDKVLAKFKTAKSFKEKFMEWLRELMIRCWDTNIRQFDENLIKATHLIRCELSKNKLGFKTFLGNTHKDLSFIPYICNEDNGIYPRLGYEQDTHSLRLSSPKDPNALISDFMKSMEIKSRKAKVKRKEASLSKWFKKDTTTSSIRPCVKFMLDTKFQAVGDGYQRAMFILVNELKQVFGESQASIILDDWNSRMDFPVKKEDIDYRLKNKTYSFSCEYIHNFLKTLGIDVSSKCNGNIYK